MRFVHTADWQLGMTRTFLSAEAQARFGAARLDAIERIGELARAEEAEFILVCGDVFESGAVSPQIVRRGLDAMGRVGVPVLLLPGNHDPADAASVYLRQDFRQACPPNVTVLGEGVFGVSDQVEVLAAPWRSKHPSADPVGVALASAPAPSPGVVRVLAGHGAVDALAHHSQVSGLIRLEQVEQALAAGTIDFLALGDRHSLTGVGSTGRVWYSGTQEVTAFDETDPGQALVVDISAGRVTVTPHRVGSWTFTEWPRTVRSADDVERLRLDLLDVPGRDRTVVRLALTGALTVAENAALEDMIEQTADLFAGLHRRTDTTVAVVLGAGELDGLGLSGYAADAVAELAVLAAGEDTAARDALTLVHRLVGAAR